METILNFVFVAVIAVGAIIFVRNGSRINSFVDSTNDKIADIVGGREKWDNIRGFAIEAIAAVEETSKNKNMTSKEKKELAIDLAQNFTELTGMEPVSDEIIGYVIEAEGFLTGIFGKDKEGKKQ